MLIAATISVNERAKHDTVVWLLRVGAGRFEGIVCSLDLIIIGTGMRGNADTRLYKANRHFYCVLSALVVGAS